jgi:hypothetical protein
MQYRTFRGRGVKIEESILDLLVHLWWAGPAGLGRQLIEPVVEHGLVVGSHSHSGKTADLLKMKSQKSAHGRLANFSERMIKIFWKKKGRHQKRVTEMSMPVYFLDSAKKDSDKEQVNLTGVFFFWVRTTWNYGNVLKYKLYFNGKNEACSSQYTLHNSLLDAAILQAT